MIKNPFVKNIGNVFFYVKEMLSYEMNRRYTFNMKRLLLISFTSDSIGLPLLIALDLRFIYKKFNDDRMISGISPSVMNITL
jgi:hypothetical protein